MSRAKHILTLCENAFKSAWDASRHTRIPGTNYSIDVPASAALSAGVTGAAMLKNKLIGRGRRGLDKKEAKKYSDDLKARAKEARLRGLDKKEAKKKYSDDLKARAKEAMLKGKK